MQKEVFKGSILFGPVPVALVTTIGKDSRPNVFTVGWIGVACTKPPMLTLAIRKERVSHANLLQHPECVINLPTRHMVREADFCGCRSASQVDKIAHFNFELEPGVEVKVPSLAACPISLECMVRSVTELGTHDLFLMEVLSNRVDPALMDPSGKIHMEWGEPIAYLHGAYYSLGGKPLGTFGYSVARKPGAKAKVSHLLRSASSDSANEKVRESQQKDKRPSSRGKGPQDKKTSGGRGQSRGKHKSRKGK